MSEHWKALTEHLPFFTLATGALRIDWGSLINIAMTGAVSGLIASQVMVVRLEERVASMEVRLRACEVDDTSHQETAALMRERISACEQALRAGKVR